MFVPSTPPPSTTPPTTTTNVRDNSTTNSKSAQSTGFFLCYFILCLTQKQQQQQRRQQVAVLSGSGRGSTENLMRWKWLCCGGACAPASQLALHHVMKTSQPTFDIKGKNMDKLQATRYKTKTKRENCIKINKQLDAGSNA